MVLGGGVSGTHSENDFCPRPDSLVNVRALEVVQI